MPLWIPAPSSEDAALTMSRWRAWEVLLPGFDAPTWHLVGYLPDERYGKVSSPLCAVNPATRTATTKSKRTYRLEGPPGDDSDAEYVWRSWQAAYNAEMLREVTEQVLAGHQPVPARYSRA